MARTPQFFSILTYRCASRHSGVPFLDIGTSKSGSNPCFFHILTCKCAAPQRRAIFRHLNFKNWPDRVVFCTFWLANVLRATVAYHFSGWALQKLLRPRGVLCILTNVCASRHSGVPFFRMSTSKIAPRLWCFVNFHLKMCFAPQLRAIFHFSAEQLPPHPPL